MHSVVKIRRASCLLAILALVLGQIGAELHALEHVRHDLAVVRLGDKKAPPLGHSIEICVAYSFVCNAVSHAGLWQLPSVGLAIALSTSLFLFFPPRTPRTEFRSRAPPAVGRS